MLRSPSLATALPILLCLPFFFFFNDTATTEIYTLSLHDALPILGDEWFNDQGYTRVPPEPGRRSEEHTSELQSHHELVCRLLLEKKKKTNKYSANIKKKKTQKKNTQNNT